MINSQCRWLQAQCISIISIGIAVMVGMMVKTPSSLSSSSAFWVYYSVSDQKLSWLSGADALGRVRVVFRSLILVVLLLVPHTHRPPVGLVCLGQRVVEFFWLLIISCTVCCFFCSERAPAPAFLQRVFCLVLAGAYFMYFVAALLPLMFILRAVCIW